MAREQFEQSPSFPELQYKLGGAQKQFLATLLSDKCTAALLNRHNITDRRPSFIQPYNRFRSFQLQSAAHSETGQAHIESFTIYHGIHFPPKDPAQRQAGHYMPIYFTDAKEPGRVFVAPELKTEIARLREVPLERITVTHPDITAVYATFYAAEAAFEQALSGDSTYVRDRLTGLYQLADHTRVDATGN